MNVLHDIPVYKTFTIKNTDKVILEKWLYLMTLGRMIDEKAPNYLKQALSGSK